MKDNGVYVPKSKTGATDIKSGNVPPAATKSPPPPPRTSKK